MSHAIFLAFNPELLQTSQRRSHPSLADFPICAVERRIRFVAPGGQSGPSPAHSNLIVYVPGWLDRTDDFARTFSVLGKIVVPYEVAEVTR